MNKTQFKLEPYTLEHMQTLCGNLDENLKAIENYFNVEIEQRDDEM
jgi:phosphate starvation-inducible PhoH-like protein